MSHQLLRIKAVEAKTGYSRATLYRKIGAHEFPAPIPLGERAVAWLESDVDHWIERRIAARCDSAAPPSAEK